jgi:hypothetical protein
MSSAAARMPFALARGWLRDALAAYRTAQARARPR